LLSDTGLATAGVAAGIKASGRPDVALMVAERAVPVAALFTQNAFAAAPVLRCREHLAKTGGLARAIVINSGNANACTGAQGEADALAMCRLTAELVGCAVEEVLCASTGVIGVPLPFEKLAAGIRRAHGELAVSREAAKRCLAAIQTTDAFEKQAGGSFTHGAHTLNVAGIAKGAGMIEPNMATMLSFVAFDAKVGPAELSQAIRRIAAGSFNAVHVDSHTSTNDSFFLLATGSQEVAGWEAHVAEVSERLAWLIARDGEGATKVTRIEVRGAENDATANEIARTIAKSALVRTALFGNDPNWGRFVSAAGNSAHVRVASEVSCVLLGTTVFERGEPTVFDKAQLSRALSQTDDVRLELQVGPGPGRATVLTSDLGYRYVEINAEYTT
jgi:glutamate N-acetyltransferase/amino-acid N-acetyltransferase